MPLFALPLAPTSSAPQSRVHLSSLQPRKRKRGSYVTSSSSDENPTPEPKSSLAAASTNPLSLTPAEVLQYKLAGLELDEELPAVKDFPHRALPVRPLHGGARGRKSNRNSETVEIIDARENENGESGNDRRKVAIDEEENKRRERGSKLRMQHLSVLTTILQRCLLEGDIPRASRAWAMLIRAQIAGREIDIHRSGYWGIGAELLLRFNERMQRRSSGSSDDAGDEDEVDGDVGGRRWGSVAGLEKARDYYERLILQYPYKRQFHGSVSALDFWPAILSSEIYWVQLEQNEGLSRMDLAEDADGSDAEGSQREEDISEMDDPDEDPGSTAAERRRERLEYIKTEKIWQKRDGIRQHSLQAAEKVAAKMDELMTTPPYSDSHDLLRLRGMLALYIGDLSVPAPPVDMENSDDREQDEETLGPNIRRRIDEQVAERRLLLRQKLAEHHRGQEKRKEEQARARKLFEKVVRDGGTIGRDIKDRLLDQDED